MLKQCGCLSRRYSTTSRPVIEWVLIGSIDLGPDVGDLQNRYNLEAWKSKACGSSHFLTAS